MLTYEDVKNNSAIRTYIQRADESLTALGYTEHSFAHVTAVAENAAYILSTLGYPERTVELAKIAGFLHDIGNLVNRVDHSQSGAVMAFRILDNMDCRSGGDRHHRHRHRQPRRGHRHAGERRGGGTDPGGQVRRAPQPGPESGYGQLRHP